MKIYIKANNDKYYEGIEPAMPGLAQFPTGQPIGELKHKNYRGVPIRDFRNDWLGEENFDSFKPSLDLLLDAFDVIKSKSDDNLKIKFFNIFWNGGADLIFDCNCTDSKPIRNRIALDEDGKCTIDTSSINWRANDTVYNLDSKMNPNIIADAYIEAMQNKRTFTKKSANLKAKTYDTMKAKYQELAELPVDTNKLTIPVDIEVAEGRERYVKGDIPDNKYIINSISQYINIEDANRYMKKAEIRFTLSQVIIEFYAKVRVPALKVTWKGATTSTQFNGACRALGRKSVEYFNELASKFE